MGVASALSIELSCHSLDSLRQLEELSQEWSQLWSRCPEATPFQSPDWLVPYWAHLGEGHLWVLAFRQGDRLVGLAPLSIFTQPETGERHLFLLGTGTTDYLDVLFEPGFAVECAALLYDVLESNWEQWDMCDFQQLRTGSVLLVQDTLPRWTGQIHVQEVCPVLALPKTISELPARVPTRMLEKLRYYRRRLQKLGPVSVQLAEPDTLDELFRRFLELHGARWAIRAAEGVLADRRVRDFHSDCARRMLASGMLRLYALQVQRETIASLYAFAHHGHTYFYLSGFDPAFSAYSPGTLLIGHAIEDAIREGAEVFDFLRGREAYKYLWGAKGRLNFRRILRHHASAIAPSPAVLAAQNL